MFCPKCAAQNLEGASFCRVCGANISLIPHALSGRLPEAQSVDDRSRRGRKRDRDVEPSIEKGIMNVFMGLGFIVAALAVMWKFPSGIFWGWSLFIPAFQHLGRGAASIASARRQNAALPTTAGNMGAFPPDAYDGPSSRRRVEPRAPQTGELMPHVPSVTEGTTRHLGAEAPTRHFDEGS
jgi:hypothetical protein